MNNYKVVIDAAHGGEDIGNNQNGIIEKEYTLRISEYIHNRLNELGIDNILTRVDDSTLSDIDRVNIINNKYGKGDNVIVISNHIGEGTIPGVEIIYALRNDDDLSKINDIMNTSGVIN